MVCSVQTSSCDRIMTSAGTSCGSTLRAHLTGTAPSTDSALPMFATAGGIVDSHETGRTGEHHRITRTQDVLRQHELFTGEGCSVGRSPVGHPFPISQPKNGSNTSLVCPGNNGGLCFCTGDVWRRYRGFSE